MQEILLQLLNDLEEVGRLHEELYDTEVRQRMSDAIMDGFVRANPGYTLPDEFGLYSPEANQGARDALNRFLQTANERCAAIGVQSFHDRLAAVQNRTVRTAVEKNAYDDFLGYSAPESFDEFGMVIREN